MKTSICQPAHALTQHLSPAEELVDGNADAQRPRLSAMSLAFGVAASVISHYAHL